jgi:hypothetical protein
VRIIRQSLHILLDAFYRFDRDDFIVDYLVTNYGSGN